LFLGWGCKEASLQAQELAELLAAPVSTTLQGLSVFPANHPLHVGMGFGGYAVPAADNAFKLVDCVLAIGTRFSEIPTGSFGMKVPEKLVHVDINDAVFSANYPASIAIQADAGRVLDALITEIKKRAADAGKSVAKNPSAMAKLILENKRAYQKEWFNHDKKDKVNPARYFQQLRERMADDDFLVVDDGNHTFLSAELMPIHSSKHFISPTDFNCMGYCVPAAIGTKLANPDKQVMGIVGDGAFLMTCMELVTASNNNLGLVMSIFNDGELAQISQAQAVPYNRKTCTKVGRYKIEGIAIATGCEYMRINNNSEIAENLDKAMAFSAKGTPVILDINIDYSKKTRFTKGIVKANLQRFELGEKVRFISRAVKRRVTV
jgi:acetolactate synthase-1/2/3 large subunit